MSTLNAFWSSRIDAGSSLMLEQEFGTNVVITEVALADATPVTSRVMLTAFVETLLMDREKQDGDFQSVQRDTVLVSFLPGEPRVKPLNVGFTSSDICHLQAEGAALIVSGYTQKSALKMGDFVVD